MAYLKISSCVAASLYFTLSGFVCLYAAEHVNHVQGWQTIQGGVVIVAILGFVAAIACLEIASRVRR